MYDTELVNLEYLTNEKYCKKALLYLLIFELYYKIFIKVLPFHFNIRCL